MKDLPADFSPPTSLRYCPFLLRNCHSTASLPPIRAPPDGRTRRPLDEQARTPLRLLPQLIFREMRYFGVTVCGRAPSPVSGALTTLTTF